MSEWEVKHIDFGEDPDVSEKITFKITPYGVAALIMAEYHKTKDPTKARAQITAAIDLAYKQGKDYIREHKYMKEV